jgi:MFS family permease
MSVLTPTENRALKAVAVQFFVNGAVVASYVPRLPSIRDNLNVDLATIGIVMAVASGFGLVGSMVQGPIIGRVGTRTAMIGGALMLVIMLPFVSLVNSVALLLLVLGALSISDVVTDVAMNMQGSVLSARREAPVMNRLHAMWSLGTVIGGVVAALMAALDVDLRVHLVGASVVLASTLLYVAPGLLGNDSPNPDERPTPKPGRATGVAVTFAALGAAAIIPEMINSDWAAFRLTDDLAESEGLAGAAYVAFTAGMVVARFAGDALVHRLGGAVVLRRATLLAAAGTLLATTIPSSLAVFAGLFIAGLGVSVMFPQLYDAAARHERPARALGGLTAGTRIALLIAPLAVGFLANTEAFTVGAAIAVTVIPAALLVWWLSRQLTSREPDAGSVPALNEV